MSALPWDCADDMCGSQSCWETGCERARALAEPELPRSTPEEVEDHSTCTQETYAEIPTEAIEGLFYNAAHRHKWHYHRAEHPIKITYSADSPPGEPRPVIGRLVHSDPACTRSGCGRPRSEHTHGVFCP